MSFNKKGKSAQKNPPSKSTKRGSYQEDSLSFSLPQNNKKSNKPVKKEGRQSFTSSSSLPSSQPGLKREKSTTKVIIPQNPDILQSYSLIELQGYCQDLNVDLQLFNGSESEQKEQIIQHLTSNFKKPKSRDNYMKLPPLLESNEQYQQSMTNYNKRREEAKLSGQIFNEPIPSFSFEISQEVDLMFHELLTKFKINPLIKENIIRAFSIPEKIHHLKNSIWYSFHFISQSINLFLYYPFLYFVFLNHFISSHYLIDISNF